MRDTDEPEENPYASPTGGDSRQAPAASGNSNRPWFWQPFHPLTILLSIGLVALVAIGFFVATAINQPHR